MKPAALFHRTFLRATFIVNYGLGWFFIDAAILSLIVCFAQRRLFQKFITFDSDLFSRYLLCVGH